MKLNEVPHIGKLPRQLRKHLLPYTIKKTLGFSFSDQEREANVALRLLAGTDSYIVKVSEQTLTWGLKAFDHTTQVTTRRYPSSDMGIMMQIFGHEEYRPAIDLLSKKAGALAAPRILDAGANVGLATLYFKLSFPLARVLCLEIDDGNVEQLVANTASLDGVTINKEALWTGSANLAIKRDFRDQTECSYYVEESLTATNLTGHSVRYYMQQMGWDKIDLLKIDIEGSERYLFESEELADDVLSTTDLLALEIHDEYGAREKIYSHFARQGFTYMNHGDLTIAHRSP